MFARCFLVISMMLVPLSAQQAAIRAKILAVAEGRADDIRRELPSLLRDYPNDPGVLFLAGILERDGPKALEMYQRIVRQFPNSEWADDSQWRIVQYYALLRDTAAARSALVEYQQRFPLSEFLVHAQNLVNATVGLEQPPHQRAASAGGTNGDNRSAVESYTLQIAAYSSKEVAEQEAAKFRAQRLRVEVIEKAPSLFAVTIGDYSSRAAAEKARPLVEQQCNCTPFIIIKPSVPTPAPKRTAK
ncbi:MAG: SPOR domain-containing protein [Chlorobi bacterium]|nr:SPOR domain-containing protein [Chlorobiota bacterium]